MSRSRPGAWPPGLVSFWDFDRAGAPFPARAGRERRPLLDGDGSSARTVEGGPFGRALVLDGGTTYLTIPARSLGALNVAGTGDECTVIGWLRREDDAYAFVAGIWNEDDKANPARQYGLFLGLPEARGGRVCGHVSDTGHVTPRYGHCREFAAGLRELRPGTWRMVAFTYDGSQILSYLDGVAEPYAAYTDELGITYSKNPHDFAGGLNRSAVSDFTVGATKGSKPFLPGHPRRDRLTGFWRGLLGGLAVFDRALDAAELMGVHLATSRRRGFVSFDFWRCAGYGAAPAADFGWQSLLGPTAIDTSRDVTSGNFVVTRHSANDFVLRSALANTANTEMDGACCFPWLRGVPSARLHAIEFRMNNSTSADSVRICLSVGGQWFVSSVRHRMAAPGEAFDWSRAELACETVHRSHWHPICVDPGSRLAVSEASGGGALPAGEVDALGIYSEALRTTESQIRITDITLVAD